MTVAGSEPVTAQFARNFVRYRNAADLSQEQLGDRSGLTRTHVANFEKGSAHAADRHVGQARRQSECRAGGAIGRNLLAVEQETRRAVYSGR
jgi:hypothetical protein